MTQNPLSCGDGPQWIDSGTPTWLAPHQQRSPPGGWPSVMGNVVSAIAIEPAAGVKLVAALSLIEQSDDGFREGW